MSDTQMLPAWLDTGAAALDGASPQAQTLAGALPGLAKAQEMTPLQRLQQIQDSGLAECSGAGEPIYLAWRQFLRGYGPSSLIIDATSFDIHSLNSSTVLKNAPWLMAEGILIAIGLREVVKIELRLPAELKGNEVALLNVVDSIRSILQVAVPQRKVEIVRDCRPKCWAEANTSDNKQLIHTPETWCRIALLFRGESASDASLVTLSRGTTQRGLTELVRSGNLRQQIDKWGGGSEVKDIDPIIIFR